MSHSSINRVVLVGRLTRDAELRTLPSGRSVCNLRIACNAMRKDAEGVYRERPSYFDVDAFGAIAENVSRYIRKGGRIAVDGRLEWREWVTAEGQRRQAVSVVADSVEFLDGPGGAGQRVGEDLDEGFDEHDQGSAGELVGVGAGGEDDLF